MARGYKKKREERKVSLSCRPTRFFLCGLPYARHVRRNSRVLARAFIKIPELNNRKEDEEEKSSAFHSEKEKEKNGLDPKGEVVCGPN